MLSVIREAAGKVGGVPKLARKLGVSRQAIYQWSEVPIDRAADLERVTGIPRTRFRPDVFKGSAAASTVAGAGHADAVAGGYDNAYNVGRPTKAALQAEGLSTPLDPDTLIDDLQALAGWKRREIENRLNVLLVHLLKWVHQPAQRSGGWA